MTKIRYESNVNMAIRGLGGKSTVLQTDKVQIGRYRTWLFLAYGVDSSQSPIEYLAKKQLDCNFMQLKKKP